MNKIKKCIKKCIILLSVFTLLLSTTVLANTKNEFPKEHENIVLENGEVVKRILIDEPVKQSKYDGSTSVMRLIKTTYKYNVDLGYHPDFNWNYADAYWLSNDTKKYNVSGSVAVNFPFGSISANINKGSGTGIVINTNNSSRLSRIRMIADKVRTKHYIVDVYNNGRYTGSYNKYYNETVGAIKNKVVFK